MNKRIIKKKYKEMKSNPIIAAVIYLNDFPSGYSMGDFICNYSFLNCMDLFVSCRHNPGNPDKFTAIYISRDAKRKRKFYIGIEKDSDLDDIRTKFDTYPGNCAFYNVDIPTNGNLNHKFSKKFEELLEECEKYIS